VKILENKNTKFVHIEYKKNKIGKCIVCLREIHQGDLVRTRVQDGILYSTNTYCPTGTEHIASANEYREYLKDNKKIKKEHLLIKLVREWELYRIRKGYMNPVEVTDVTKEHKEAYNSYVKWQIKKEEDNFLKLYNKFQKERKESVDKIVKLQDDMDLEWRE
jgi:formylmethanofuran dehydrogenase subunit E|tara:strand:- start:698 stop:1183 length:486 start_codon:yes stop_codon:yes gene_type:complete